MKIIYIFFCVFFVGCINVKKELKISDTIDYNELNIFISDSLPILVDFDEKHSDVFSQWHEILLISNIKNISKSDSREVNYILSALKSDILKINDKNVPHALNHPQIIGRFRVLKTDILKINIDDLSTENSRIFKTYLKDIVNSYNAFVNTMNSMVNKNDEVETINLDI
jgi:hypothetical protein